MDGPVSDAAATLVGMGLPGIVILGLVIAVVAQARENRRIQQARIDELKETERALRDNTQALETTMKVVIEGRGRTP